MLLVSLGLIDLGFYTDAEQTAANARRFVAEARTARPAVRMVLLPVIPNSRAEEDAPSRPRWPASTSSSRRRSRT